MDCNSACSSLNVTTSSEAQAEAKYANLVGIDEAKFNSQPRGIAGACCGYAKVLQLEANREYP